MAWENIAKTVVVLSMGGIIAFGAYTLVPTDNYLRIDRTCHPIHIVRDFALARSDVKTVGMENASKYVKLMDYMYDDICVPRLGHYAPIYTSNDVATTLAYNKFRNFLINSGLDKNSIDRILNVGVDTKVNWVDESESMLLYNEFLSAKIAP